MNGKADHFLSTADWRKSSATCRKGEPEFHKSFYRKGKRHLDIEVLNPLHDIGLAIWFGDCGHYLKGCATLNTHIWGEQGSKVVRTYLQCIGYESVLVKERGCFRVRLDEKSSEAYLKLIVPHLPTFVVQEIRRENHVGG